MTGRALVVHGVIPADAPPDELATRGQAANAVQLLQEIGFRAEVYEMSLDLRVAAQDLKELRPDVIFNMAYTLGGSCQLGIVVPFFLDFLGLSYTGASARANYVSTNKPLCKSVLMAAGVATPPWANGGGLDATHPNFAGPYIIKSEDEHGSMGLDENSVVDTWPEARAVVRNRERSFGGRWFVEKYIEGREFAVPMLADYGGGVQILPISEQLFDDLPQPIRIKSYNFKWGEATPTIQSMRDSRRFHAELENPVMAACCKTAIGCWNALGMAGHVRIDVRVDCDGTVWVLDVNSNPSLHTGNAATTFVISAEMVGISPRELMRRIVESAQKPVAFAVPNF